MTLESMICRLGLKADDSMAREDRHARVAAVQAGLKALRDFAAQTDENTSSEEAAAVALIVAEYEYRLSELSAEGEAQASAHRRRTSGRRHRLRALRAERAALDDLWRRDVISDETHRPLQQLLDHEEAMHDEGATH
jgi:CPA1 family monovalent cation:H+ antiporter